MAKVPCCPSSTGSPTPAAATTPTTDSSSPPQGQLYSNLEAPTSTCSITSTTNYFTATATTTKNDAAISTAMRALSKTESSEVLEGTPPMVSSRQLSIKQKNIREQLEILHMLCTRLDLLTVGSWLLVPSIVAYHASALMTVQEQSVVGDSDYSGGRGLECFRPWIMAVGVFTPLVAYKTLARLERARAGRKGHNAECTGCPYSRLKSRLMSRLRQCSSGILPTSTLDVAGGDTREQPRSRSQSRVGPKPKTLLLRSVGLWTVLMIISARLRLNHSVPFMSTPSSSPSLSFDHSGEGIRTMDIPVPGFAPELSSLADRSEDYPMLVMDWTEVPEEQQQDFQYFDVGFDNEDEDYGNEIENEETDWAMMDPESVEAMVRAAENDDVMDSEWDMPQLLETSDDINYEDTVSGTGSEEEMSALLDFWDSMERVVEEEAAALDAESDYQDLSTTTMSSSSPSSEPMPLSYSARGLEEDRLDDDSCNSNGDKSGRVFEYVPVWTEAMLFAVSACVGAIALGIRQARHQAYGLASKLQNELRTIDSHEKLKTMGHPSARMMLSFAAFSGLACWVFHSQAWDLPTSFFNTYIGVVFMIVTQAWVPEDIEDLKTYVATDSDVVAHVDQLEEACHIAIDEKNSA